MSVEYVPKTEIDEHDIQISTLSSKPGWIEHDLEKMAIMSPYNIEQTNFETIKILESLGCEVDCD